MRLLSNWIYPTPPDYSFHLPYINKSRVHRSNHSSLYVVVSTPTTLRLPSHLLSSPPPLSPSSRSREMAFDKIKVANPIVEMDGQISISSVRSVFVALASFRLLNHVTYVWLYDDRMYTVKFRSVVSSFPYYRWICRFSNFRIFFSSMVCRWNWMSESWWRKGICEYLNRHEIRILF